MTTTHTQGRLRVANNLHSDQLISDTKGPGVRGYDHPSYGGFMVAESVHPENARRLAACWNACEGIETDKLEKLPKPFSELLAPGFLQLWSAYTDKKCEVEDLRAERDALLALVTELMDTELADIACAGSHAPVEDLLGRIKATAARIRQDIARGSRQSDGKLPG